MPLPSAAFPRKKKPALTAKEAMRAKAQARAGKRPAKPGPDRAAETTAGQAANAVREEPATPAGRAGGDAKKPRDAAATKPRDAAAAKPRNAAAAKPRDAAATPGDAAPGAERRGEEQTASAAPAQKPGLFRRLLNLFRRSR
ncbi:hypothetical protein [Sorangium cellulosum]|uniref:hypothetical protein n=1 Tax=Sorangium cellulosum TaxID=56 RepID=UPI00133189D4|nr:hypothetical protein [Sorangium cellulosum]